MGSDCYLHFYADSSESADCLFECVIREIVRIESRYSRYRNDSFLAELNEAARIGSSIKVDNETANLIDYAFACYQKSDGLFDITSGILRRIWNFSVSCLPLQADIGLLLPLIGLDKLDWNPPLLSFHKAGMELDFGGIGKEYAADQAAAICRSLSIQNGLIDLGGDIVVIGPHPNQEPWIIGIRHPRKPNIAITTVSIDRGALATSGDYERFIEINGKRFCHLLNPKTGWPSHELASVSVFADQCLVAGSLSSIAMLKGKNGLNWLDQFHVQYIGINSNGQMSLSCSKNNL